MVLVMTLSGGQANSNAKGSLGGQRSDTLVVSNIDGNIYDDIPRSEGLLGKTEYRCGYIYNPDATTYTGVFIQMLTNPLLSKVSLGLDPAGKGDGRTGGIAASIVTEDATPTGVAFFGETNPDDGLWDTVRLPIGIMKQGESVPFWMKRKTEQGASQVITFNFVTTYETAALPGETIDDGGAFGDSIKVSSQGTGTFLIGTGRMGFSDIGPNA